MGSIPTGDGAHQFSDLYLESWTCSVLRPGTPAGSRFEVKSLFRVEEGEN